MRKLVLSVSLWLGCLCFTALFHPAEASCTRTLHCGVTCSFNIECPSPYLPWTLACSTSEQVLTCTGPNPDSSCTETATSITCDTTTLSCWPNWCRQTATSVACGNTLKTCQQCQASHNCPL